MQLIAWISMVYLGLTFGLSFSIVKIILMEMDSPIVILFWQSCFSSFLLFAASFFSLNGLRDIIAGLGNNKNFIRLRVGIDHPGKSKDVTKYVLSKPSKKDKELLTEKMRASINSLEIYLNEGLEEATLNLHT